MYRFVDGSGNGVVNLGAVWGATLVGIDKSRGDYDYVKMCAAYFDPRPNYKMVGNGIGRSDPDKTFWYTLFPNIIFAGIAERSGSEAKSNVRASKSQRTAFSACSFAANPDWRLPYNGPRARQRGLRIKGVRSND